MAEKEKKKIVGLLLALGGAAAGWAMLTRKAKAEEGAAAEIGIAISADPNALVEGATYPAWVKVTNKSTKGGVYVPATLTVRIRAQLAGVNIGTDLTRTDVYPANTQLTIPEVGYDFTIPSDGGGKSGNISVWVSDPAGNVIKTASLAIRATALTGEIGPGVIIYEGLAGWEEVVSGREIPWNKDIYLAPYWVNTSPVDIVGHIRLTITYPNGYVVKKGATWQQDMTAAPGEGFYVAFEPFLPDTEGVYSVLIGLSTDGKALDSETFTLVVTAEIIYGADVVVSI